MAKYWSQKNKGTPRDYRPYSKYEFVFDCPHCDQEYSATLSSISSGKWCGCTKKKTETKIDKYLHSLLPTIEIIRDKQWKYLNDRRPDFRIDSLRLIIEYDGEQHFEQRSNWDPPESNQKNDVEKTILSLKQGYSTIRLSYKFMLHTDWESKLKPYIKSYPTPTLILLNDEDYSDFKALYNK